MALRVFIFVDGAVFVFGDPEGLDGFEDAFIARVSGVGGEAGELFDHEFEVGKAQAGRIDARVRIHEIFGDCLNIEPAVRSIHGRLSKFGGESSADLL